MSDRGTASTPPERVRDALDEVHTALVVAYGGEEDALYTALDELLQQVKEIESRR